MKFGFLKVIRDWSAIGFALLGSLPVYAQSNLIDLGPVAPALAINNSAEVVLQNYLYSNGALVPFPSGFIGAALNANGQVAGSSGGMGCEIVGGLDQAQGCAIGVYANGAVTTYPIHNGSLDPAVANQGLGINSSGEVVGAWVFLHGQGGAIDLNNGVFTELSFPSSQCSGNLQTPAGIAYAINDAGQIAGILPYDPTGSAMGSSCAGHAFLNSLTAYHDIGLGAALALNAGGTAVGYLQFGDANTNPQALIHAFKYSVSEGTEDLGTLLGDTISTAYAVNLQGLIVGTSETPTPSPAVSRAFFYDGAMQDLNTFVTASDPLHAFVQLTDARGINDTGLVVVNGIDTRTQAKHAYLLQAPMIQVAPGSVAFASGASAPQSITFTNVGSTPIVLSGSSATTGFDIGTNSCGTSLAAAASCSISVAFVSATAGSANGQLTLSAGGVPIAAQLTGSVALAVSISASSATVTSGAAITLTWSATSGGACTASGGSTADGWTGTIAASGTKTVTESAAGTYNYGLTCVAGSQTESAQTTVVDSASTPPLMPPSSGSSGGGAFDALSVLLLIGAGVSRLSDTRRRNPLARP